MSNSKFKVQIDSTELVFTEGCNAFPQFEITLDVVNVEAIRDKIAQYKVSDTLRDGLFLNGLNCYF